MVYIYLQKCLVYLCKAELDREKCTILFFKGVASEGSHVLLILGIWGVRVG